MNQFLWEPVIIGGIIGGLIALVPIWVFNIYKYKSSDKRKIKKYQKEISKL